MTTQAWSSTIDGIAPAIAIEHAIALLETAPETAEQQAKEVLRVLPDDARAVYIIGAARRRLGDPWEARRLLELVTSRRPDVGRAGYELGLTLVAIGEARVALDTLRAAARRDPCANPINLDHS